MENNGNSAESLIGGNRMPEACPAVVNAEAMSGIFNRGSQLDWSSMMTKAGGDKVLSQLGFSDLNLSGNVESQPKNCFDSRTKATDDALTMNTVRPGEPPIVIKTSNGTVITIHAITGGAGGASVIIEKPPGQR
jgi:hypothetical protein